MLSRARSAIGPTPDAEALQVVIPCRHTADRSVAQARHPVTIHADWSVDTPHDLALERVSVALGGHSSCVSLNDRALPALRSWVGLMLRVVPPGLRAVGHDTWTVGEPAACCRGRSFTGAEAAGHHVRSIPHLAARFDADWDVLATLAVATSRAYGSRFDLRVDDERFWLAHAACAEGFADLAYLWKAGISPDTIVAWHNESTSTRPVPRRFFTAVMAGADVSAALESTDPHAHTQMRSTA